MANKKLDMAGLPKEKPNLIVRACCSELGKEEVEGVFYKNDIPEPWQLIPQASKGGADALEFLRTQLTVLESHFDDLFIPEMPRSITMLGSWLKNKGNEAAQRFVVPFEVEVLHLKRED